MSKKTIILVRHGESRSNAGQSHDQGDNPGLTKVGREQAEATAEFLETHHKVDRILCSPFRRCIETAIPISRSLQKPIVLEPLLHEFFNEVWFDDIRGLRLPSLRVLEEAYDEIEGNYVATKWWPNVAEREYDVHDRCVRLKDELFSSHSEENNVLCVGHWATVSAMAFQFISDLKMGVVHNASVTVVEVDGESSTLLLQDKCDHHAESTPKY